MSMHINLIKKIQISNKNSDLAPRQRRQKLDRSPKCKAAIVVITGETGSIHGEFIYRKTCPNKKTSSSLKKTIQIKFSN